MAPPEGELEEARAALAPTLEAAAAILPWVAKPKAPRFPPEVAKRWQEACRRLATAWSGRHGGGLTDLRPAVFALCAVALELGDIDCLRLAEGLASATDHLDAGEPDARLAAALSATLECLGEADGLEHDAFPERARHFAQRLEHCADPQAAPLQRSPVIDRLFVEEAGECLDHIRDALAALPPDAYAVKQAAGEIVRLAEPLELDAVGALAGRLDRLLAAPLDLEAETTRAAVLSLVAELETAIAAVAAA